MLCWNRSERFIPAAEAFALYEQNWREVVDRPAKAAAKKLLKRNYYLKRCISALSIADATVLASGLARLAVTDWTEKSSRRRPGK